MPPYAIHLQGETVAESPVLPMSGIIHRLQVPSSSTATFFDFLTYTVLNVKGLKNLNWVSNKVGNLGVYTR